MLLVFGILHWLLAFNKYFLCLVAIAISQCLIVQFTKNPVTIILSQHKNSKKIIFNTFLRFKIFHTKSETMQ